MKLATLFLMTAFPLLSLTLLVRYTGEEHSMSIPSAVIVKRGDASVVRTVTFLRHWPIFGWYSPRYIEPSLKIGTVIEVNLDSPEISDREWKNSERSFRIQEKVSIQVTHTYFLNIDKDLKGAKRVTLRIMANDSIPSDAIHQEDWFWVREFYDCEVISTS